MPHFTKPTEGSWTEHFGLATEPVSYDDSTTPEFYELERDAIFRRTWLNVGRVEQLPKKGSYFTRDLDAARTSVIIVRDMDGEIRVLPQHVPTPWQQAGVAGLSARGNEGRMPPVHVQVPRMALRPRRVSFTFVQQESEFFGLDKSKFGLVPVNVRRLQGFIFVNFDREAQPLKEYMGRFGAGIEGYPFHLLTQKHTYRGEVASNWKLFIDAFMEFYHAPVLHAKQAVSEESRKLQGFGYEALAYDIDGPHAMISKSWGGMSPPKDLGMVKPIERVRGAACWPVDSADIGELPEGLNPTKLPAWGLDTYLFFPNFMLLIWEDELVSHVPLLAHFVQHPHLRDVVVLRAAEERLRTTRAGASRGDLQGIRPAGRQHARGNADDARDAGPSQSSPCATRKSACSATSTRPPASTWPPTREHLLAAPVRASAMS